LCSPQKFVDFHGIDRPAEIHASDSWCLSKSIGC
jgi:hypothetical protein